MARLVVALVALAVMSAGSMYWAAAQQEDASRGSVTGCPASGITAGIAAPLNSAKDAQAPSQCPMMQAKDSQSASSDEAKDTQDGASGCPGCGGCGNSDGTCPK